MVALASILITSEAFYAKNSGVIMLDSKNFKEEVLNSDEIWLVEFFAPWCGHCKALKPAWEKAAKALKGVVKVGAVDMDADRSAGAPYGIKGFPTIKIFGADKKKPSDYQGGRDEKSIVDQALKEVNKLVKERQSGKSKSSGGKSSKSGGGAKKDGEVIVLTDSNFNDIVYNSKDIWMIEFYAPWCGHCKKLQPEWEEAARALKGQVKFAKVDATEEKSLASRFQVQGYPTIKYWDYGAGKSDKKAKAYNAGREASDLKQFASNLLEKADIDPDVFEITNHKVFDKECTGGVCIVSFLPNIYESSAKDRNAKINTIKKVAKQSLGKPFTFFWAEAGNNIDLENNLGLGFGFPAVIAVSPQKKQYGVMKGSFSESGLKQFNDGLMIGKTTLSPLPANFSFKKISAWDGKDAPPIEEEQFEDL